MRYQQSREDVAAQVKEQADIVKIIGECVSLKKSGARFLGLCPFHGEKTPSFTVHPAQQFFHCFGCGESGDVFNFMMKYYHLDFLSALKELARRYQIVLPERPRSAEDEKRAKRHRLLYDVNRKAADIYRKYLLEAPGAEAARGYLDSRGVIPEIQEKFHLGYAPSTETMGWEFLGRQLSSEEKQLAEELGLLVRKEGKGGTYDRFRDRILFPIFDISGQILGFGGRILGEGQPKYMNSPESPIFSKSRSLLGLYQQKDILRQMRRAVLVEGNFDLISLVQRGCRNVVAPLGTALTREQVRLLKRYVTEATLLFDGDAAGTKAAVRAVPHFFAEQMTGRVALLPEGHDPDTFIRQEGLPALQKLFDKAESLPEFVLAQLIQEHGLSLDGKTRIIEGIQPLIEAASSPLQRSLIISHFSEKIGIPAQQMEKLIGRGGGQQEVQPHEKAKPRDGYITPLASAQRQLVSFMLFYPQYFDSLSENGLRECLAGSIGEVLFLQMQALLSGRSEVEPEELLSALPEGAERNLVADLLLKATERSGGNALSATPEEELADLLEWLKRFQLQQASENLQQQIANIGVPVDGVELHRLVMRKHEIDRQIQGLSG
ncbi:MAG: DNA primase [Desulfobulbaceae bacterium]|nr:MAG: DNA primase [Desulfobulbaceae bacterium]